VREQGTVKLLQGELRRNKLLEKFQMVGNQKERARHQSWAFQKIKEKVEESKKSEKQRELSKKEAKHPYPKTEFQKPPKGTSLGGRMRYNQG